MKRCEMRAKNETSCHPIHPKVILVSWVHHNKDCFVWLKAHHAFAKNLHVREVVFLHQVEGVVLLPDRPQRGGCREQGVDLSFAANGRMLEDKEEQRPRAIRRNANISK